MPLSEDEQRILDQIEANLYETDPALARDIADTTVYTVASRNLKWGVVGVVVGLVLLIAPLFFGSAAVNIAIACGGFLVLLASLLAIYTNLRKMGRARWEELMQGMKSDGMKDYFGNRTQRMRDRFRKDDEQP